MIDELIKKINKKGSPVSLSQCLGSPNKQARWHAMAMRAPHGNFVATQAFGSGIVTALENLIAEMEKNERAAEGQDEFDDLC